MNGGVAIAVADEQVATWRDRQVGWPIERPASPGHRGRRAPVIAARIRRPLSGPALEHLLALECEFADFVVRIVDDVQRVFLVHLHAVGAVRELALPPG